METNRIARTARLVHGKFIGFDGKAHFALGANFVVPAGSLVRKARFVGCVQVLVPGGDWRTVLA